MLADVSSGDPSFDRATLRDQDELLLRELVDSGVVDGWLLDRTPLHCGDVSVQLVRWLQEGRPESLYYLFCRLNSARLVRHTQIRIDDDALPLHADELVAESLARFFADVQQSSSDEAEAAYQTLPALADQVLEEAVQDILAYVPGVGLELAWHPAVTVLTQESPVPFGVAPGTVSGHAKLTADQFSALLAQALLRLSLHDRRHLLTPPNRWRKRRRGAAESLTRAAAHRRLREELCRSLQWLNLEQDLLLPLDSRNTLDSLNSPNSIDNDEKETA